MNDFYIRQFKQYLLLERSLSEKTAEAYMHDIRLLADFLADRAFTPVQVEDLQDFIIYLKEERSVESTSQARIMA